MKDFLNINNLELFLIISVIVLLLAIAALAMFLVRKNNKIKIEKESLEMLTKALTVFVESKDDYTAQHHRNVANLATTIAKKMGLPDEKIKLIYEAAIIHDIGKINIPDAILSKNTKLTESEIEQIKSHPVIGYNIIKAIHNRDRIARIILQHHERNDGSGYPYGLTGDKILLEAKIIAVADVFEAMASKRPYGEARRVKKVIKNFNENKGTLFDPDVVRACTELFPRYNEDNDEEPEANILDKSLLN